MRRNLLCQTWGERVRENVSGRKRSGKNENGDKAAVPPGCLGDLWEQCLQRGVGVKGSVGGRKWGQRVRATCVSWAGQDELGFAISGHRHRRLSVAIWASLVSCLPDMPKWRLWSPSSPLGSLPKSPESLLNTFSLNPLPPPQMTLSPSLRSRSPDKNFYIFPFFPSHYFSTSLPSIFWKGMPPSFQK